MKIFSHFSSIFFRFFLFRIAFIPQRNYNPYSVRKRSTAKIIILILNFFLIFQPAIPPPSIALYAAEVTLNPTGQLVPTVPAVTDENTAEVKAVAQPHAESLPNVTDFIMEGGISRADDEEVFIESNDPFYSSSGSWGQSYDDLWWLKRVRADQAWSISRGTDVPVAVIDTGFDFNHPDLASNLWSNLAELNGTPGIDDDHNGFIDDIHGWDFYNQDNDPRDDHGHGTAVSGVIAAVADNTLGIAGIAPESKIIPIKVLNSQGSGFVSHVISAIRYAADLGAKVINMSLGVLKNFLSKSLQTSFQNAVSYAKSKGSVLVAAAGNENSRVENSYPAGIKDVIAVGAIEPVTDQRAYFSNFGKLLDFVAPGVDILSLRATGTSFGSSSVVDPAYSRASGTSFSSPIVAGVVALIRSKFPLLNFDNIYQRLRSSAVDLGAGGFDNFYGYGLVDALGALTVSSVSSINSTKQISIGSASVLNLGYSFSRATRGAEFNPDIPDPMPASDINYPNSTPLRFDPFMHFPIFQLAEEKNKKAQNHYPFTRKNKKIRFIKPIPSQPA